ncbi:MAG: FtsX-like permease family protein, partial [Bryobacteraceae bacterium]
ARDSQDHNFRWNPVRRFYVSYMQPIDGLTTVNYEIRTRSSPAAVASLVREAVQGFNRTLPVISLKTVTTLMDDSIATERLVAKLSVLFGALAAILAAIGLYGVMSYTVARRTNEIGIRVALGAQRWQVVSMVLREITILIVCGAIVGAASASGLTKYVATLIFGLKPNDPWTFVGAGLLLLIVGVFAGYLPARRAAGLDPVVALRHD